MSGRHYAPGTLILQEFASGQLALSPAAHTLLTMRYPRQLEIVATGQPGMYRVTARQYVGRIGLPDGGLLVIEPKVGVYHLFHMLTVATDLVRFQPPPADLAPDPEIFSFVLATLVRQVEQLLRAGLYQGYEQREEDLPFVRGRIDLPAQLRRYGELRHRHVCSYAARTPDTIENRIIATTLRTLPALLQPAGDPILIRHVRALGRWFADVTPISRGAALAALDRLTLHRLNVAYGPVLGLCRLALHHLSLAERAGPHPFASFLVEMPRLFERYVTVRLRESLARAGLRVVAQRRDYLDEARRVGIRPDVLVYPSGGDTPCLVLDTKYRRLSTIDSSDLNTDLYQVSAYMDRYGLQQGVLVYPRFSPTEEAEVRLRGTLKRLKVLTIDLSAPSVAALEAAADALGQRVAALARGDEDPLP
jgi:5-methylcytosine-specific restriction enzyme subunit McrC